jgi:hypothetical protein
VTRLFLVGLSFDGVGALLIAWPILSPGLAARESGRPRWDGDHLAPFRRDREARLVQLGAAFLGAGFVLQAVTYTVRLGCPWWGGTHLIAGVAAAGIPVSVALARRGQPGHVWYPELVPSDEIADGLRILESG